MAGIKVTAHLSDGGIIGCSALSLSELTVLQMPCSALQRLASAVWLFINHSSLTGLGAAHSCHTGPLGSHPAPPSWKPGLPEGPCPYMGKQAIHVPSSPPAATAEPETQRKEFPLGSSFQELGSKSRYKLSRHPPPPHLLVPRASWETEVAPTQEFQIDKGVSASWLSGHRTCLRTWALGTA